MITMMKLKCLKWPKTRLFLLKQQYRISKVLTIKIIQINKLKEAPKWTSWTAKSTNIHQ